MATQERVTEVAVVGKGNETLSIINGRAQVDVITGGSGGGNVTVTNTVTVEATAGGLNISNLQSTTDEVKVYQGTTPWVTSGGGGGGNVTVTNTVTVEATAGGLNISALQSGTDEVKVYQGTDPWSVDGNVTVTGTVTVTGEVTVTQGTDPWSVDGNVTVAATDLDIRNLVSATDLVKVYQGTDPWAVNGNVTVTGTVSVNEPVSVDGNVTVTGEVTATQGTTPWTVDGTVSVNEPVTVDGSVTITGVVTALSTALGTTLLTADFDQGAGVDPVLKAGIHAEFSGGARKIGHVTTDSVDAQPAGVAMIGVRRNAPTDMAGANAKYTIPAFDADGKLWVNPSTVTAEVTGTVTVTGTVSVSEPVSVDGNVTVTGNVTVLSGNVTADTELTILDYDTSVGTDNVAVVGLRIPGFGGSTHIGHRVGSLFGTTDGGILALTRRSDSAALPSGVGNGDYTTPIVDIENKLWITGAHVDDGIFAKGLDPLLAVGAILDDVSPGSIAEGDIGALRMSANRLLYSQMRDAADEANITSEEDQDTDVGVDGDRGIHTSHIPKVHSTQLSNLEVEYTSSTTNPLAGTDEIDCRRFTRGQFSFSLVSTGLPTWIRFEVEFSPDGGTTWFKKSGGMEDGFWANLFFDDVVCSSEIFRCYPFNCDGIDLLRFKVETLGTAGAGVHSFTVDEAFVELKCR